MLNVTVVKNSCGDDQLKRKTHLDENDSSYLVREGAMEPTVTSMSEDFEITGSTSPSLYLQKWIWIASERDFT